MPEVETKEAEELKEDLSSVPILEEEILWPENSWLWTVQESEAQGDYQKEWAENSYLFYGDNRSPGDGVALDLANDSYIWCDAGPRGAGKTTYMTYIAEQCAYLYKKRIISNYPIHFGVRKLDNHVIYIKSEPLEMGKLLMFDESYQGCIIVLDEAPQVINRLATMTWKNRLLDLWLQQIRKNRNSLIYASQNEYWVDNELRWQTDIIAHCRDASRRFPQAGYRRGGQILIDLVDNSGMWTGYSQDERPWRRPFRKRLLSEAIWNTFNTFQHNDVFESLKKVKLNVGEYQIGEQIDDDESYLEHAIPIVQASLEEGKVKKRDFYDAIGELKHSSTTELGTRLRDCGVTDTGHGRDTFDFSNFNMDKFMTWKNKRKR